MKKVDSLSNPATLNIFSGSYSLSAIMFLIFIYFNVNNTDIVVSKIIIQQPQLNIHFNSIILFFIIFSQGFNSLQTENYSF